MGGEERRTEVSSGQGVRHGLNGEVASARWSYRMLQAKEGARDSEQSSQHWLPLKLLFVLVSALLCHSDNARPSNCIQYKGV